MLAESMGTYIDEIRGNSSIVSADIEGGASAPPSPQPKPVVSSPLGGESPSRPRAVYAQALGVIVGFFAEKWLEAFLVESQGLDVLMIFILILVLWMMVSDWIQAWWATPMPEDKRIWSQGWVMFVHFISYALTLVVFRYMAVIVGEEWTRQGLGLAEGILHGILFLIYFFFIYLYFLKKL